MAEIDDESMMDMLGAAPVPKEAPPEKATDKPKKADEKIDDAPDGPPPEFLCLETNKAKMQYGKKNHHCKICWWRPKYLKQAWCAPIVVTTNGKRKLT